MSIYQIKPFTYDKPKTVTQLVNSAIQVPKLNVPVETAGDATPPVTITPIPAGSSTSSSKAIADYGSDAERLTNIISSDATQDAARIAYLQLIDAPDVYTDLPNKVGDATKAQMAEILTLLKSKYNKFIITGWQDTRQEKSQITPTTGDTYVATFTGKEPHVIGIQGHLIFDYNPAVYSWYHAFINAYEYYLRASRTAKHRAKIKLVFPDVNEYEGYILNLNTSMTADNDIVIPLSFSYLVTNDYNFKPAIEIAAPPTTISKKVDVVSSDMKASTAPSGEIGPYAVPNGKTTDGYVSKFTSTVTPPTSFLSGVSSKVDSVSRDMSVARASGSALQGYIGQLEQINNFSKTAKNLPADVVAIWDPQAASNMRRSARYDVQSRERTIGALKSVDGLLGAIDALTGAPLGQRRKKV